MDEEHLGRLKIVSTRPPCVKCNTFLSDSVYLEDNLNKLDNGDPDMVHMTVCPNCGLKQVVWYPK